MIFSKILFWNICFIFYTVLLRCVLNVSIDNKSALLQFRLGTKSDKLLHDPMATHITTARLQKMPMIVYSLWDKNTALMQRMENWSIHSIDCVVECDKWIPRQQDQMWIYV